MPGWACAGLWGRWRMAEKGMQRLTGRALWRVMVIYCGVNGGEEGMKEL